MSDGLVLEFGPPIAYRKDFALMLDSVPAAVMLSQAVYWMGRTKREDGFFYKSGVEWTEETGVSSKSLRNARKKLNEHDWWTEKKLKANGVPTMHYHVDLGKLQSYHREWVESWGQMDCAQRANGKCQKGKSITESTTETTTVTTPAPETDTVLSAGDADSTQPVLAPLPVSPSLDTPPSGSEQDGEHETGDVPEQNTPRSGYGNSATSTPSPSVPYHADLSVDVTLTPQAPDTGTKKGKSTSTKNKRDPEEWREFVGSVGLVTRGIRRDKWDVLTKQVIIQVTKHANELWKSGIRNEDLRRFYKYRKRELAWKQVVTPSDITTWYAAHKDRGKPGEERVRQVDLDLTEARSAQHSAPVRVRKKG